MHRILHRVKKNEATEKYVPNEGTSEKNLNEAELSNLPGKEFKVIIIKVLNELRRRMSNKQMETIKKYVIGIMELKSIQ